MADESGSGEGLSESSDLYEETMLRDASTPRVVIVTGLSGSGKSTAMRALEDAGFFCIDNMPVPLLPRVLELTTARGEGRASRPYAFAVDTREPDFLSEAGKVIEQLRSEGVHVEVMFLEADDDILVRRYSETRRRHPMSAGGTVREGIENERDALAHLRDRANLLIDTTEYTVHSLKAMIQEHVSEITEPMLTVTVMSFGFKYGVPPDCDLMFDVRFLPNPYFIEEMRDKTGLDQEVADYVLSFAETGRFIDLCTTMLEFSLPLYEREGKTYLTIGIGCTGGKHRSVAVSEVLCSRLRGRGWHASPRHRDRGKWVK